MPWLEVALAALASVVVTLLDGRDVLRTLGTHVSGDLGDPLYFAWQLAWVGHALRTDPFDPAGLFTTNAFQARPDNLAYTDVVLGYAPLAALVPPGQTGALMQLNLAMLLATATATFGAYLLARVLGARVPGAVVAAAGFGFAPWRDVQVIHINVVSTGGIVLTAALLVYGHAWSLRDGLRPHLLPGRVRWAALGWLVACWQLTLGFATGIWFGYFLAAVVSALALSWGLAMRGRGGRGGVALPRRLLAADLAGGVALLVTTALLLLPHLWVLARVPEAQRSEQMLDLFSPPWFGLLTAGPANDVWGGSQLGWQQAITERWPPEMYLSPGVVLIGLAVAGLVVSCWSWRARLVLGAGTALLAVLALGTRGPAGGRATFLPLWHLLPGWDQLRTPGRLVIWVTIGLCLLAAGAVSRVAEGLADQWTRDRARPAAPPAARRRLVPDHLTGRGLPSAVGLALLLAAPGVIVYGEGRDAVPRWPVSRAPVDLAALPQPLLILPTAQVADYHLMFWSTQGWPVIANGDSGFNAVEQVELRTEAAGFPDAASVAALRARGIATVVLVPSRVGPDSPWANAAATTVTGLGIGRQERPDAVVYDLRGG